MEHETIENEGLAPELQDPGERDSALDIEQHDANLLESLRQKRQELADHREGFVPVPGYEDPELLIRYRVIDSKEIQKIGNKVIKETKDRMQRQLLAAVDTFIAAATGVYVRLAEDTEPVALTLNGREIEGFSQELATAMNFPATTARDVVFGVFAENDIAIMNHAIRLNQWMTFNRSDIDREFLGE
jgi:hypothetical protein